jgi:hypothetical protein
MLSAETTSLFAFSGQVGTLLDEELALLRGRDGRGAVLSQEPHNKLVWNTSQLADSANAYMQVYGIADVSDAPGGLSGDDRVLYPQGHGDAWGHYLSAIKPYYRLLRHPRYAWRPSAEAVNVAGTRLAMDFAEERRFAKLGADRAKLGGDILLCKCAESRAECTYEYHAGRHTAGLHFDLLCSRLQLAEVLDMFSHQGETATSLISLETSTFLRRAGDLARACRHDELSANECRSPRHGPLSAAPPQSQDRRPRSRSSKTPRRSARPSGAGLPSASQKAASRTRSACSGAAAVS